MSKAMLKRIKRLEGKTSGNGLKRYMDAISDTTWGLPSEMRPISPEKQLEISNALAQMSEEFMSDNATSDNCSKGIEE
jgi:hypothetical protein